MEIEVRILVGRDEEGVRVTGKGIRDRLSDPRYRLGNNRLALALVGRASNTPSCLFSCHASIPLLFLYEHQSPPAAFAGCIVARGAMRGRLPSHFSMSLIRMSVARPSFRAGKSPFLSES